MPDYSEYADAALLERGRRLLEQNALAITSSRQEADGFLRLRGRSTDSFNFVDHPALLLGPDGKIRDFRCDCGEGRRGAFCVHCAAMALKAEELLPRRGVQTPAPVMHAAAEAPAMKAVSPAEGEILRYSFPFHNSSEDLYGKPYDENDPVILDEKNFIAMFGDNEVSRILYDYSPTGDPAQKLKVFGGICYGMAAANSIFNWPSDKTPPSDFCAGALRPFDLPLGCTHKDWDMALRDYLEILYFGQLHPEVQAGLRSDDNIKIDMLFREMSMRINNYRKGTYPLCIMGISKEISDERAEQGEEGGGHALLPYRVEEDEKGPCRLALYDCNAPGQERYMEFLRDEKGTITGWRYDMDSHGIWGEDKEGCEYHVNYSEHDMIHEAFETRPNPFPVEMLLLLTNSKNITLRNADNAPVLQITDTGSYKTDSKDVRIVRPLTMKRMRPMVHLPAGKYSVDVRDGEYAEVTFRLAALNRSVEIRTDADEFSFEVDEVGQICMAEIPQAERTYYITLHSTDPQDQQEVRLEGITGYAPLRFGQIRHILYVEGINERTQQDLYVNGVETSVALLKQGFPQEEKQEQKKQERELLYNFPAEDPSEEED